MENSLSVKFLLVIALDHVADGENVEGFCKNVIHYSRTVLTVLSVIRSDPLLMKILTILRIVFVLFYASLSIRLGDGSLYFILYNLLKLVR